MSNLTLASVWCFGIGAAMLILHSAFAPKDEIVYLVDVLGLLLMFASSIVLMLLGLYHSIERAITYIVGS